MPSRVRWLGDQAKAAINRAIDARMDEAGKAGVAEARRLVHKITGYLDSTIGYTYNRSIRTLQFHADAKYASIEEMGNSRRPGHPYLRPALNAVGRVWGGNVEIRYPNVPQPHPGAGVSRQNARINRRQARGASGRARIVYGRGHARLYVPEAGFVADATTPVL